MPAAPRMGVAGSSDSVLVASKWNCLNVDQWWVCGDAAEVSAALDWRGRNESALLDTIGACYGLPAGAAALVSPSEAAAVSAAPGVLAQSGSIADADKASDNSLSSAASSPAGEAGAAAHAAATAEGYKSAAAAKLDSAPGADVMSGGWIPTKQAAGKRGRPLTETNQQQLPSAPVTKGKKAALCKPPHEGQAAIAEGGQSSAWVPTTAVKATQKVSEKQRVENSKSGAVQRRVPAPEHARSAEQPPAEQAAAAKHAAAAAKARDTPDSAVLSEPDLAVVREIRAAGEAVRAREAQRRAALVPRKVTRAALRSMAAL